MVSNLKQALNLILSGEPIIVPTDTVYGLVCRHDSKSAIEKIYKLKKRETGKPLILLGYNWKALQRFVCVRVKYSKALQKLIKTNWPGPLTIILPASNNIPKCLNEGFKTIGIRVPKNKFLLGLLKYCPEQVLASTSANLSGESDHYPQKALLKKAKFFIEAKKNEMSLKPSRILEFKKNTIKVLR